MVDRQPLPGKSFFSFVRRTSDTYFSPPANQRLEQAHMRSVRDAKPTKK